MEKIIAGDVTHDVIQSGTVAVQAGADRVIVQLRDLEFVFHFLGTADATPRVDAEASGRSLILHFHNFNNPLGTSFSSTVGNIDNRVLFLSIIVHAITGGDTDTQPAKVISYTFMAGKSL